jgi:hypothetical protein
LLVVILRKVIPMTEVYRALRFEGLGLELSISKAVAIRADIPTLLNIERMSDGTYKLLYNATVIPDFTKLEQITVVRHDN